MNIERYEHSGDTEKIINLTLGELGLDEAYLKVRLGVSRKAPIKWDGRSLSAYRWFQICDILHIPVDSVTMGYNRRMHKARLSTDRDQGLVVLPRTTKFKEMLRELKKERKANYRSEASYYGFRLRWKIRRHRFKERLRGLPSRCWNQLTLRWQAFQDERG